MCPERQRFAAGAVWALAAGLLAMYLLLFGVGSASRLGHPMEEVTYGESWLLDGARQVAGGEGLYAPADRVPMMHIAYTPLYYLAVGGLERVFGDVGYTTGRALSLCATLVGAAALAWSLRRLTTHWWVGLLGAGLFLTQNLTVLLWAPLHRVDPLALGLTLCGLAFATAGRASLASVLFLLALATKQTFFVAPLAVLLVLWPCRRKMAHFAVIMLGGTAAGVAVAEVATHGWFLWHTVSANGQDPDLTTFATLTGSFLQYNGLPVLAALASFALPALPGERLWRLYFIGCLLTLPSIAKLGASSNYWLELTAATAALVALGSYRLTRWPAAQLVAPTMVVGSLLIAVPGYQATAVDAATSLADVLQPATPRYLSLVSDVGALPYRVEARFVAQIAREPGELLTDNSGLAVAAGKRIEFEFQIFQLLAVGGHWSEQPILEAIAAHCFSLVALMHPLDAPSDGTRWTPAMRQALMRAYAPAGTDSGFWLYRPRDQNSTSP